VPGMLMFYGVVVWAGVRSFSTVFRRDDDSGRLLVGAFWAAALGYLVQLLFGVSVTGVTFLLWIALAVALAPTARLVEVRAPRWGVVAGAAVLAVCVVGIGYQGVVLAADNAYMKAQASSSAEQRIKDAKRAVRLFPYSQTYRWGLGVAYMEELKLLLQEGSKAQQAGEDTAPYYEASKQAFVNAEAAFRDAIAFVPDEYDDYVSLAELYTIAGQVFDKSYYQQALDVVAQGLKVEPYGTTIRVQMAKALWDQGKKAEAEKVLRYCLEIDPMGGQAALQLATFLYDQGKTAEALQILLDVNARAPGQAGVAEAISQLEAKQQQ
jgi:tetratricopeptide (TPR) repeat protein